ncbi:MAG: T9SS type A sorting domain-containing protein [Saprospiraceae bacterium]|nr:T9SS type A sorting domain-containing protein [Saprospiraceae bacterium]
MVEDTCVGVKQVKAMIGQQVVLMIYNPVTRYFESHVKIKVPVSEIDIINGYLNTTYVSYEAIDSCHNKTLLDSLPLFIVDRVKPVAICDKGINITITDSIQWVHAASFDEGSWDNCGLSMLLARRSDWATACGVNLCDDIDLLFTGDHHDSIWFAQLEGDKHINPVEAHYQQAIDWLCKDGQPCSYPFLIGWFYDLVKYASLDCIEHPYPVNADYIHKVFLESYGDDPLLDIYQSLILSVIPCVSPIDSDSLFQDYFEDPVSQRVLEGLFQDIFKIALVNGPASGKALFDVGRQIGGGWSDAVPFCCEDACQDVMVEVIAMDYWCNWSKCWTTVRVEDKTPPEVVCELYDVSVTCSAYKTYYAPAVEMALQGNFDSLQSALGRYDKVTKDSYGQTNAKTTYTLYDLSCDSNLVEKDTLVYDEHLGYVWKTYSYYRAEYDLKTSDRFNGQIADNCGLQCIEEKPWISLDECGNGFVKRVFKFVGQCVDQPSGHFADTITRYQTIWITSDCEISKAMFEVPKDTMVFSCGIEYNADGSGHVAGVLSPEFTGLAKYVFDNDCRLVGIGYYDKVFKIVGGDQACYKVLRTWCFADWCAIGEPIEKSWWFNPRYAGKYLTHTQKIIVFDSSPPICTIDEIPAQIETAGCTYDLNTEVIVEDECGILDFSWRVTNLKTHKSVASGYGQLNSIPLGAFTISVQDLEHGSYQLKVTVTDECQNESVCYVDFNLVASKKPTPVCMTSLTTDLTPMDGNGDGVIDTAMAVVWANEFNVSSQAACGASNSKLSFRVDRSTGDAELPSASATNLSLGCQDIGSQEVRLYVIDEQGNWDYCNVILVVQDNTGTCNNTDSGNSTLISGTIMTEEQNMVELASVALKSEDGEIMQTFESSGNYRFEMTKGINAIIQPTKNTDFVNGVSTRDLISIQKQILGKEELSSWYKKRAADANGDGKISALDLIQFRKLILGKSDSLPDSPSWRFFERNTNQESYFIEKLGASQQVDFIGVKMGDVNGDNDPSRKVGRSSKAHAFVLKDQSLIAGNAYKIPVLAADFRDIEGFQFTLIFDDQAILLQGLDAGALSISKEHFDINQTNRFVTMSWNTQSDIPATREDGIPLFYIDILALNQSKLSDIVTLNSSKISSEVYRENLVGDLVLKFDSGESMTGHLILLQNQPNPFQTETKVGFYIDEAGQVHLSVFDLTGTQLQTIRRFADKGYNEWIIKDLPASLSSGLLYYKVETARQTAIKKMVLLR